MSVYIYKNIYVNLTLWSSVYEILLYLFYFFSIPETVFVQYLSLTFFLSVSNKRIFILKALH